MEDQLEKMLGYPERVIREASNNLSDGACDYYLSDTHYYAVGLFRAVRHELSTHIEESGQPDYVEWELPTQSTTAALPGAVLDGPVIHRDGSVAPVTSWRIPVEQPRPAEIKVRACNNREKYQPMCDAFSPAHRRGWPCSPMAILFPVSSTHALIIENGCTLIEYYGEALQGDVTPGEVIARVDLAPRKVVCVGGVLWINRQPFDLQTFEPLPDALPPVITIPDKRSKMIASRLRDAQIIVLATLHSRMRYLFVVNAYSELGIVGRSAY
jgi:hypothetical protein